MSTKQNTLDKVASFVSVKLFMQEMAKEAPTVGQKKYLVSHQLCKFSHLKI